MMTMLPVRVRLTPKLKMKSKKLSKSKLKKKKALLLFKKRRKLLTKKKRNPSKLKLVRKFQKYRKISRNEQNRHLKS